MEQTEKKPANKPAYKKVLSGSYKVIKKVVKYGTYIALIYFAYKGFMTWK